MIINIAGGTGIMGKVHKPIFETAGHKIILSGRNTQPNLIEAAKQADLTIVSVPISATQEIIKKIAPHCKAIMDFTSLKIFPIKAMLENTKNDCEVAGLHPLYGDVDSIKNQTVVFCPTKKTGEKCKQIINALEQAGAKIKIMINPENHDKLMAIVQNKRKKLIQNFGSSILNLGVDIKEIYQLSPPPTKILLDLLARQIDEKNDQLYQEMDQFNPFSETHPINNNLPPKIREFYGEELAAAQERARKHINNLD